MNTVKKKRVGSSSLKKGTKMKQLKSGLDLGRPIKDLPDDFVLKELNKLLLRFDRPDSH